MIDSLKSLLHIDGWQPIETAPKDGTPVLLLEGNIIGLFYFGTEPGYVNFRGEPMKPTWIGTIIVSDLVRNDTGCKMLKVYGSEATLWMPLPPVSGADQP
ncbi:hypothetical protein [Roseibium aggregatum]|jgi:hypothetical protein|uniref:DUF551 domain-containing protein n=1 Tax=Roseibium aggregatum TaxID=187304 RepID=A0A0M6YF97_9HYPH|nr:hypothetical protein [Roseibium aggregatum]MCR9284792.1 hypothetical protein [Paracoccaceae bacterium]MEC9471451.1 hypothetical protein [Pseudomonadota bacterium]CTQ47681.1 hypothetical protein LAL4801_06143 [Roseibium aggregatum]